MREVGFINDITDSRKRILKAAEDIFAEKGLAGARVNEIAARAGINKRMLYHYYGNKEDLYLAVLKSNLKKIYSIQDVLSPPGDPVERVERAIREYFYFLAKNPNFVRLMEWEFLQGSSYISKLLPLYNLYSLPAIEKTLERGVREGIFRDDIDSRQLVLSVNAMCFFYFNRAKALSAVWEGDMLSPEMLEKRLGHILQVVFRAILRDPDNRERGI